MCAVISSSIVPVVRCSGGTTVDLSTLSVPYTTTESSSVATTTTLSAYAPLLQIMYQSSDVLTTTTSSSSSSITTTSSGQGTNSSGNQGSSTGTSASIGVSVGLGVVILATAAFYFWRIKRKNTRIAAPGQQFNAENVWNGSSGEFWELQGYHRVPGIDSHTNLQEVQGGAVVGQRAGAGRVQQISPVELA